MAKAEAKDTEKKAPAPKRTIDGKTLMKRLEEAFRQKEPWEPILREIFPLTMAARNPYDPNKTALSSSNMQFDSTAPVSLFKATNRVMSEMTPVDQNWIDIDVGPALELKANKQQLDQLKKNLSAIVKMMEVVFSSGGFVNGQWECFLEMLGGIMGCMLVLEDPDDDIEPVSFQCVSQSEVAIELDGKGKTCGVYRKKAGVKIREITEIWTDAKLTPELAKMLQDAKDKKDPEVTLMESTYRLRGTGGKWAYCIHYRKDGKDPQELVYREYGENPWIIYQWSRMPGSPYGPGPSILLLPAIRMVNKVREMIIMNAALALAGMYLAKDDGVLNIDNIQIIQGGIIPVGSTGGTSGASLAPLETGRDFRVAEIVLRDEQDNIRRGLFDNGLPDPSEGVRSPTEILERVRELAQDVGGAIGRITRSLVELVKRVAGILQRRGMIPAIELDQFTFKVNIKSPLARAQQLQEVQADLQWYQMIAGIVGPELAMLFVNVEKLIERITERMGIDAQLLRDDAERGSIQESIAKILAAQQGGGMPAQPGGAMPAAA